MNHPARFLIVLGLTKVSKKNNKQLMKNPLYVILCFHWLKEEEKQLETVRGNNYVGMPFFHTIQY